MNRPGTALSVLLCSLACSLLAVGSANSQTGADYLSESGTHDALTDCDVNQEMDFGSAVGTGCDAEYHPPSERACTTHDEVADFVDAVEQWIDQTSQSAQETSADALECHEGTQAGDAVHDEYDYSDYEEFCDNESWTYDEADGDDTAETATNEAEYEYDEYEYSYEEEYYDDESWTYDEADGDDTAETVTDEAEYEYDEYEYSYEEEYYDDESWTYDEADVDDTAETVTDEAEYEYDEYEYGYEEEYYDDESWTYDEADGDDTAETVTDEAEYEYDAYGYGYDESYYDDESWTHDEADVDDEAETATQNVEEYGYDYYKDYYESDSWEAEEAESEDVTVADEEEMVESVEPADEFDYDAYYEETWADEETEAEVEDADDGWGTGYDDVYDKAMFGEPTDAADAEQQDVMSEESAWEESWEVDEWSKDAVDPYGPIDPVFPDSTSAGGLAERLQQRFVQSATQTLGDLRVAIVDVVAQLRRYAVTEVRAAAHTMLTESSQR